MIILTKKQQQKCNNRKTKDGQHQDAPFLSDLGSDFESGLSSVLPLFDWLGRVAPAMNPATVSRTVSTKPAPPPVHSKVLDVMGQMIFLRN